MNQNEFSYFILFKLNMFTVQIISAMFSAMYIAVPLYSTLFVIGMVGNIWVIRMIFEIKRRVGSSFLNYISIYVTV